MPRAGSRTRRPVWIVAVGAALLAGVGWSLWMLQPAVPVASAPAASPTSRATPAPEPTSTPTPTGAAADTTVYDTAALPQVDVFAVIPTLPVDPDPYGGFTLEVARAITDGVPVFADPTGQPVAALPRENEYGGTTVPVVERQDHWVRVLLVGRQALPSQGSPAQLTGWLRMQDVEVTPLDTTVEVGLTARTIDIVRAGVAERIGADFASGTAGTPTPVGRSFIMTTRVEPSFGYTRGHPLVYLSIQSPTLDGFGGAGAAITAFHYHDVRSGPVSNGCIRVDPAAIESLALLPAGTPVVIRP